MLYALGLTFSTSGLSYQRLDPVQPLLLLYSLLRCDRSVLPLLGGYTGGGLSARPGFYRLFRRYGLPSFRGSRVSRCR